VPYLEPLLPFWRAQDALLARVDPVWWGAVVSDPRFPAIHDANYARVETAEPVTLEEVEALLLPALKRSGARQTHVVIFLPEEQTDLLAAASARGERLAWDLVMAHPGPAGPSPNAHVEEIAAFDDDLWSAVREAIRLFGLSEESALDQAVALERDVMLPAGRRWFVARDEQGVVGGLASLTVLEGVGFVDLVATLPQARRRGHATALTRRALREAEAAGGVPTYLLAEPGSVAVTLYERLGFERVTQIASWITGPADRD
jgi:ribosomal protein S18 acetylase RimI-like enzyme